MAHCRWSPLHLRCPARAAMTNVMPRGGDVLDKPHREGFERGANRTGAVLILIKADAGGFDNLHANLIEPYPQAVPRDHPPPLCKDFA
jgi:hypothetical protein